MKAELTSYNQPPRKVRLVTELVKGKKVSDALAALSFLPKRASLPIAKLIQSAAANAVNLGQNIETLCIQNIEVNSAGMIVRMMPRAMGRGVPIRHRKSRVMVTLISDAVTLSSDTPAKTAAAKKTRTPRAEKVTAEPVVAAA
jgi:large subunit ribosomal protein L22